MNNKCELTKVLARSVMGHLAAMQAYVHSILIGLILAGLTCVNIEAQQFSQRSIP